MTDSDIDARSAHIDSRFEQVDARFWKLEDLIKSEGITTRRHFDVVAEDMKSQVKLIAEGHSVLAEHIVEVRGGIERLEAGQTNLVLRVSVVEARVTDVERTQKVMLAEVRSLAARK